MGEFGVCLNRRGWGIFGPALPAPPLPRADFILIFNQVLVPLILYVLLTGHIKRRHQFFEWLVTIIASAFVCLGTQQRVLQIHGTEWDSEVAGISRSNLKFYFTHSLMSWIACIVLDGRHTVNICRAHGKTLPQLLRGVVQRHAPKEVLEALGLLTCCASMLKFATDVYGSFQGLTHDNLFLHTWFFLAVIFKISRILMQGLVVLASPEQLMEPRHRTLTSQLVFSSVFLTIQVLFLAQFTPAHTLSLLLLGGDVTYRVLQCLKIGYHWWYDNHGNNHNNDGHNLDNGRNPDNGDWVEQETKPENICFVFSILNVVFCRESSLCKTDYFVAEESWPETEEATSEEVVAQEVLLERGRGEKHTHSPYVQPFLNRFGG